jgi:hypothetical protein
MLYGTRKPRTTKYLFKPMSDLAMTGNVGSPSVTDPHRPKDFLDPTEMKEFLEAAKSGRNGARDHFVGQIHKHLPIRSASSDPGCILDSLRVLHHEVAMDDPIPIAISLAPLKSPSQPEISCCSSKCIALSASRC